MFVSISSNDINLLNFLKENFSHLTSSILVNETHVRALHLHLILSDNNIKIESPNQESITIIKPFHFSNIINKLNIFEQKYFVEIGTIKYFPFLRSLMMNNQKSLLSETQNQILSRLVCFKIGIEKKTLYESIWPRDKNISDNKLDTHLTNLRNHIYEFSEQKLNFKTLKGSIKLDIN